MESLDFLEAPAGNFTDDQETLTPEQFRELTAQIEELRTRLSSGGNITLDEARQIGVWFRARRRKAFSVMKEKKPPKERATKAAGTKTKKVLTAAEQQEILNKLLGDL